jgi:hypothetical protein
VLLDFDAETKFPYGSKASVQPGALGHNLIHRICEKVGHPCRLKKMHAYVFPRKSRAWMSILVLAHIVFHNLCEHLGIARLIHAASDFSGAVADAA